MQHDARISIFCYLPNTDALLVLLCWVYDALVFDFVTLTVVRFFAL